MSWLTSHVRDHVAAPSTPSRALDAAFQPNANGHVLCGYTIQHVCAHGNDGTVQLLSDAANPPTILRGLSRAALTDDAASMTVAHQLTYIVPPGHYVKLVSSGTGTPSIVAQYEDQLT